MYHVDDQVSIDEQAEYFEQKDTITGVVYSVRLAAWSISLITEEIVLTVYIRTYRMGIEISDERALARTCRHLLCTDYLKVRNPYGVNSGRDGHYSAAATGLCTDRRLP